LTHSEGAVFALEEPEVFLHPQKARFFKGVLTSLSTQGNQVIISTHSPVFVDISEPETVCLVRRTEQEGTIVVQREKADLAPTERTLLRLLTEFDAQRNELFFAKKALIVEGGTEKLAIPLIASALKQDLNRLGISVIECGGKPNLQLFLRVANAISIPCVTVADEDLVTVDESWDDEQKKKMYEHNKQHTDINRRLSELALRGTLFFLKPNFEGVAGLPRNPDTKLDRAIEKFHGVRREDIPPELLAPVEALLSPAA
jgi:putative ATP-dependent endonuclease of the OLD family